jgi:rhombotail lipoprotein
MRTHLPWCAVGLGLAAFALASGCATESRYYSSVVQYLYPGKSDPVEQPTIPELTLPMKVGVAFVPEGGSERRSQSYWRELLPGKGGRPAIQPLSEQKKMALMEDVSRRFRELPFISSIEHIPSAYLTSGGSFANLDQIRTMYGVDAIALLSYDQMQFTEAGGFSFLYWTLIGAYVIPAEKNTTQTMMDAAVYDIKSRKMLFRAPGVSQVKGNATPANLAEELRKNGEQGFQEAAQSLVTNLETQLTLFQERVKRQPEQYRVVHSPGYTGSGGGSMGWVYPALLALGGAVALLRRRR